MNKSLLGRILLMVFIALLSIFILTFVTVNRSFQMITQRIREENSRFLLEDKKDTLKYESSIVTTIVEGYLMAAGELGTPFSEKLVMVRKLVREAHFGKTGYFFLYDYDGTRLSYRPDPDTEMKTNMFDAKDREGNYLVRDMIEISGKGGGFTTYYWENPATGNVEPKIGYYAPLSIGDFNMFLGVGEYINDIDEKNGEFVALIREDIDGFRLTFIITQSILTLVILLLLAFVLRTSLKPLQTITASLADIATGDADLRARIDVKSSDEIGRVAENFNCFTDSLRQLVAETQEAVEETVAMEEALSDSTGSTSSSIEEINGNIQELRNQLERLNESIRSSVTATEQISSNIGAFDGQIESQAQMVEESTAAITEMISSLESVDGITRTKKEAVGQLSSLMAEGKDSLKDTRDNFTSVVSKIDSINEMTSIISSIASQTNLLSMNAAIEAAHAGDAGKGFAVVAEEIRKLADSTSVSSSNIARQVQDIAEGIRRTNDNVIAFDDSFSRIGEEIGSTVQAFQEIEYSISELNAGGTQILRASNEINNVTSSIRGGSAEIRSGIRTIMEAGESLRSVSEEAAGELEKIGGESRDITSSITGVVKINGQLSAVVARLKEEFGKFRT